MHNIVSEPNYGFIFEEREKTLHIKPNLAVMLESQLECLGINMKRIKKVERTNESMTYRDCERSRTSASTDSEKVKKNYL